MTPKQEAQELYNKIENSMYLSQYTSDAAKQCTLIAVDKIIKSNPSLPMLGDGYLREDIELSAKYWEEVKTEIEKI